ncbi:hypothetical protein [Streptomyces sp. bgisy029]|uniref:hypothetical protein n=1 Tax=Streptomyces sp. bgisy029 TaxID=3413771 RepID=UPI003D755ACA
MNQDGLGLSDFLGPLLMSGIGGTLLYFGLPSSGPVKCGDSVMSPGEWCGPAGHTQLHGGSNYDTIAAEQHAASVPLMVFGIILLGLGLLWFIVFIHVALRNSR